MSGIRCSIFFAISVMVLFLAASGCGKKAMPTPPESDPLPAVSDLSHEVHEGYVHLAWSIPDKVAEGRFGRGAAVVSRAKTRMEDDGCDDCPLVFQQVAVVPVSSGLGSVKQTHREAMTSGFRYTFRVVLQMGHGRTSEASNLVSFVW